MLKAGDKVLRSMTGYGRSQKILNGRDITVEIRSVNHRYYEYSSRIPRVYNYIDEKLKMLLKGSISRGKVEVAVTINNIEGKDTVIHINKCAAEGYVAALRSVADELGLEDDLRLSNLIKLPDIFNIQKAPDDEEQIWSDISEAASEALEKFVGMRRVEGERLKADVLEKTANIETMVGEVEKLSPVLLKITEIVFTQSSARFLKARILMSRESLQKRPYSQRKLPLMRKLFVSEAIFLS